MQWYYRSVIEWACLPLYISHKHWPWHMKQVHVHAIRKALEINREVFKNQFDTIKYNLFTLTLNTFSIELYSNFIENLSFLNLTTNDLSEYNNIKVTFTIWSSMYPIMVSIINEIEIEWIIQKNALSANFEGEKMLWESVLLKSKEHLAGSPKHWHLCYLK